MNLVANPVAVKIRVPFKIVRFRDISLLLELIIKAYSRCGGTIRRMLSDGQRGRNPVLMLKLGLDRYMAGWYPTDGINPSNLLGIKRR